MKELPKVKRQAVIVIHGLGEQRPMETLRSFVKGVQSALEDGMPEDKKAILRSQPDSIGDIYETTKLSLPSGENRPITDFYEFYWAHNMRDSKFSNMLAWINRLLFTPFHKIPSRLHKIYINIWLLILSVFALVLFFSFRSPFIYKHCCPEVLAMIAAIMATGIFHLLMSWILSYAKDFFFKTAGDAARYFSPVPDNIAERSNIRHQGVAFLEKLHKLSTFEKPDRIIIVGHSLGAVIAYDLMRLLWTQYNTVYAPLEDNDQPMLSAINDYAIGDAGVIEKNIDAYQDLQYACWQEQRSMGNPWKISDFITLGSPLHAIDYLMVTKEKIEDLKKQREIPAAPPIKDALDGTIFYKSKITYSINGNDKYINWLNHGAMFGPTRWTNIFYTSDFVGGSMKTNFGPGVKEIVVPRRSAWFFPAGHTAYWDFDKSGGALKKLVEALKLTNPPPETEITFKKA